MNRAESDLPFMRLALRLARRGYGFTSPNPAVGAVLVKRGVVIGRGWHHRAGEPHAEIEALRDAQRAGHAVRGATLYVTLEPCSTHGRTPPCVEAIIAAGLRRVVVAATDPNPAHAGRGFDLLRAAGIEVVTGIAQKAAASLNEAFNHWIVHRTPFVLVKAAMTLDGKIATASGESKWITSAASRAHAMTLRRGADAVMVGVNTVLADDPKLTFRGRVVHARETKRPRRLVLDPRARTPRSAAVVADDAADLTTIFVGENAPPRRIAALARRVRVVPAPLAGGQFDLGWILRRLGEEQVTSLLVEGGGETSAAFFEQRLVHRIAFYYAPKILGGRDARKAVAGRGANGWAEIVRLREVRWRKLGEDLLLTARVS